MVIKFNYEENRILGKALNLVICYSGNIIILWLMFEVFPSEPYLWLSYVLLWYVFGLLSRCFHLNDVPLLIEKLKILFHFDSVGENSISMDIEFGTHVIFMVMSMIVWKFLRRGGLISYLFPLPIHMTKFVVSALLKNLILIG